jgi:mRNA interferase HigB
MKEENVPTRQPKKLSRKNKFPQPFPVWEQSCIFVRYIMRIIAVKTLKSYWEKYPDAQAALFAWYEEVCEADWSSPNEMKEQFRSASVITGKRVVYNIHGNSYRLLVDIEFKFKIVFIVWFGTHKDYDKLDAKTVKYVKAN